MYKDLLRNNIIDCKSRVDVALASVGRTDCVTIVGASKTMSDDVVAMINDDKLLCDLGENRVQELTDKFKQNQSFNWHFIGYLQSNKVKQIIKLVSLIHSVDRFSIAKEISKQAALADITVNVLVQVNMGREDSKSGFFIEDLDDVICRISKEKNIRVCGVMAVMPVSDDNSLIELYTQLGDHYKVLQKKYNLIYLSAGMTNDFELAIKYAGSNIVRLGRAIFGERSGYGKI